LRVRSAIIRSPSCLLSGGDEPIVGSIDVFWYLVDPVLLRAQEAQAGSSLQPEHL
jgi:hypothetical protein